MQTKTVVSITREGASLKAITSLQGAVAHAMQADGKEAASIQACAKVLADQVAGLTLPLASKVALIRATYADEFTQLGATTGLTKEQAKRKSNVVASLNAALVCYCAADMPVEVKAPSEGKDAEFKPARDLSLSAMRANAAAVKETAKAQETQEAATAALAMMSAEEKAKVKAEAEKAAEDRAATVAEQNKAKAKKADGELVAELAKRLGGILADSENRSALEAAFLTHGLHIAKAKAQPKTGSMAEQLATLTK